MLTFWIIAGGLILIALAFVIPPFFKKSSWDEVERNQMNRVIYEERVAELEQQALSPEEKKLAQQELDKTLLGELQTSPPHEEDHPRARWASLLVILCLPLFAIGGYLKLGSPQLITASSQETEGKKLPTDFDKMVSKLATRLEKNPNDEEGWRMLARSYAVLGDYAQTVKTYNKILAKFGPKAESLTDLAEFLAKSEGNELNGLPNLLLKKALELDPNYQGALWLAGFSSAQGGDFKRAIEYWERFLTQIPKEETEARKLLEQHIADARRQIDQGTPPAETAATQNTPETTKVPNHKEETSVSPDNNKDVKEAKIQVRVNLDARLQDKAKPEDTLFIYARATEGPPMPLAIVKKKVSDLPLTITLEDSMAMVPAMKLSNYQKVTILARISGSGSAALQSGDLQGEVTPVTVGKQEQVEVTINQLVP